VLAYRERRRWHRLGGDAVNDYIKRTAGADFSAKDFRTWNATVFAAAQLASTKSERPNRQRIIRRVTGEVAELLGNTAAVARRSYIDPRVFDRFLSGSTVALKLGARDTLDTLDGLGDKRRRKLELAVLDLLD
jgi:DNA topoisomerase IB